jgi:mRNA-degrading endonuclease RelE of RelBE toxin-antitoxin system
VVIIETSIFSRQVQALLSDEEYRSLQKTLVLHPELGPVISGSGGLRKIRWAGSGRGKRGGVRTIYYWAVANDQILMLFMYAKNDKEDLTPDQLKVLRKIVEEEFHER